MRPQVKAAAIMFLAALLLSPAVGVAGNGCETEEAEKIDRPVFAKKSAGFLAESTKPKLPDLLTSENSRKYKSFLDNT